MAYKNTPLTGLSVKQIQILIEARNRPGVHTYYPSGFDAISHDYKYEYTKNNQPVKGIFTLANRQNVIVIHITMVGDTRLTFAESDNRAYIVFGIENKVQMLLMKPTTDPLDPYDVYATCAELPNFGVGFHVIDMKGYGDYVEVTVDGRLIVSRSWKSALDWKNLSAVWVKNYRFGALMASSLVTEAHCVTTEYQKRWQPSSGLHFPMPGVLAPGMKLYFDIFSTDTNPATIQYDDTAFLSARINKNHVRGHLLVKEGKYVVRPLVTKEEYDAEKKKLITASDWNPVPVFIDTNGMPMGDFFDIKKFSLAGNTSALEITLTAIEWRRQDIFVDVPPNYWFMVDDYTKNNELPLGTYSDRHSKPF